MGKQTIGYAACIIRDKIPLNLKEHSQNSWNLIYCQNSIVKYNLSIMILFLSYLVLPLKLLLLNYLKR